MGLKEKSKDISEVNQELASVEQPKHKKSEKEKRKERRERKRLAEDKEKSESNHEPIIEEIKIDHVEDQPQQEEEQDSQDEEEKKKQRRWWPAMTNAPPILNKLLKNLCGIDEYEFSDIFTFDEEYLKSLSSKPTLGVFFCLPIFEKNDFKKNEDDEFLNGLKPYNDAYFFKQTIMNSCSTLCICYLVANHLNDINKYQTPLMQFILETSEKTVEERIEIFEQNKEIAEAHFATLKKKLPDGKKKPQKKPTDEDPEKPKKTKKKPKDRQRQLMAHFVCFTEMDGLLLELDSRRDSPIVRGKSTPESVLMDSIQIIQKYFEYDLTRAYSVTLLSKKEI